MPQNSTTLPEAIECISGNAPGPTGVLLKQVHGDELGGKGVVDLVTDSLRSIACGTLLFGVGNPRAAAEGKRFIDHDLNRSFGRKRYGYEGQRATELEPMLRSADYLLDVHSTLKPSPPIVCYPGDQLS